MSRCSRGHPQPTRPQGGSGTGLDLRAMAERGGPWRSHLLQPACPLGPKLQLIPGFFTLCAPPAFVCSSSPSCSIQQPPRQPALAARRPWSRRPLRRAVKGRPSTCHILSAHLKILLLLAWATKKGAAPGPLAPHGPAHKRAGDKDIFRDGRCWCRIPPGVHGQKKGEAGFPRAAQTCRGRSVGRAPREGRLESAGT